MKPLTLNLKKIGNSFGFLVPKPYVDQGELFEGTTYLVTIEELPKKVRASPAVSKAQTKASVEA